MGAEGNIEESMKLMGEVEELNRAKAEAEVSGFSSNYDEQG